MNPTVRSEFSVTGSYNKAHWNASGEIPFRAVTDGTIGRFGAIDASEGGKTEHAIGRMEYHYDTPSNGRFFADAYLMYYKLDLFTNFTFFLDNPVNGAGVHYWARIAERYGLNLTVVNEDVDPTFRFMTVDWDGQIRMDPSLPYAMQRLIGMKDRFHLSFACDTDHDRHGIVTRSAGLLPPNHYLSAAIFYLFRHRPKWSKKAAIGKTVVSSQMIDHVAPSTPKNSPSWPNRSRPRA